jgi:hypothetical protein
MEVEFADISVQTFNHVSFLISDVYYVPSIESSENEDTSTVLLRHRTGHPTEVVLQQVGRG